MIEVVINHGTLASPEWKSDQKCKHTIDFRQNVYDWLENNATGIITFALNVKYEGNDDLQVQENFWWVESASIRFENKADALLFKLSCL